MYLLIYRKIWKLCAYLVGRTDGYQNLRQSTKPMKFNKISPLTKSSLTRQPKIHSKSTKFSWYCQKDGRTFLNIPMCLQMSVCPSGSIRKTHFFRTIWWSIPFVWCGNAVPTPLLFSTTLLSGGSRPGVWGGTVK